MSKNPKEKPIIVGPGILEQLKNRQDISEYKNPINAEGLKETMKEVFMGMEMKYFPMPEQPIIQDRSKMIVELVKEDIDAASRLLVDTPVNEVVWMEVNENLTEEEIEKLNAHLHWLCREEPYEPTMDELNYLDDPEVM